jgi:hypothetical protein
MRSRWPLVLLEGAQGDVADDPSKRLGDDTRSQAENATLERRRDPPLGFTILIDTDEQQLLKILVENLPIMVGHAGITKQPAQMEDPRLLAPPRIRSTAGLASIPAVNSEVRR